MSTVETERGEARKELLARRYDSGSTITNCVPHIGLSILERPADCPRCTADVKNHLSRAIAVNEWLNQWKDDATDLLLKEAT